uniref:hypothetical protein n=1 Tax=Helicobacter japonicus TaxID=425400 RepID=UPI0025B4EE73
QNNKIQNIAKNQSTRVGAAFDSPIYEEITIKNKKIINRANPTKNGCPKGALQNTGITLIALIITIILLLILAGVTIHFTLGENGILKNAEIAGNKYKEEEQKEKNALDEMYSKILVADGSKVTLTMEQLDEYIDRRIEEKSANKASAVVSSSETYQTNNSNENVSFDSI